MSVNISASNLLDLSFPADVEEMLDEAGVPPRLLQLEITENVLMADPERARTVIDTLSATGVEISLDDFGTGYSSLAYLRQLAVDELKIDRSFVMSMATDESAAAIVRSLVDLAKSMSIRTVAEGVETEDALDRLAALGCEQAQGFLFSRPLSGDQFERWMVERRLPEARGALHRPREGAGLRS
jgi:EAL domain-containing protein (putative c-di-GMP-specific phosphodiesterase class I)